MSGSQASRSAGAASTHLTSIQFKQLRRDQFVAIVVGLAFVPLLSLCCLHLWSRPHYQFFPIIIVGFVLLVRSRWPAPNEVAAASHRMRLPSTLLLLSWILLLGAVIASSPRLAGVAALVAIASMLMHFAGPGTFRSFSGAWSLLWLIVPLPLRTDSRLIEWLQAATSSLASISLDRMGIRHLMEGNILEFPQRRIFVAEACSGIHSVFALTACAGLFVVWVGLPTGRSLLLVGSAFCWAGLTNAIRIITVAAAYARYDIDLTTGWIHELLGVMVFALALLLVASTDQMLQWLGHLIRSMHFWLFDTWRQSQPKGFDGKEGVDEWVPRRPLQPIPAIRPETAWNWRVVAVAFGILGLMQTLVLLPDSKSKRTNAVAAGAELLTEDSLPSDHNGWQRTRFDLTERAPGHSLGLFSKSWVYRTPICPVAVSFDYPFAGFHDLTTCSLGNGWNVVKQRSDVPESAAEFSEGIPCVEAELTKPTGEHGYLLFGALDADGQPLSPDPASFANNLKHKVSENLLAEFFAPDAAAMLRLKSETYQIQTFLSTDYRLPADQRAHIREQFQSFAQIYRARITRPAP